MVDDIEGWNEHTPGIMQVNDVYGKIESNNNGELKWV